MPAGIEERELKNGHQEFVKQIAVTRNGNEVVSLNTGRVPYPTNEGEAMLQNVEIKPGETHNYVLTFEFKETGLNQDIDKNKKFYTKLVVTGIN